MVRFIWDCSQIKHTTREREHEMDSRELSLVEAAYRGEYDTVKYLVGNLPRSRLDETSTVKKVGSSGGDLHNCTALNIACINGFTDIARLLLEAGASHDIRDCTGSTPFSEAVYHNQQQLVDLLPQFGADINSVNSFGWTPLHVAAFQGRLETVQKLLALRADVTRCTPEGHTPLHMAPMTGKKPVVTYLLDSGISPSFVEATSVALESYTPCPLFLAVVGHFKSLVNRFLQHPDCPLSCRADAMMLTGAVDVLDGRIKQAQSKWSDAIQFRQTHELSFSPSPSVEYGNRCEVADLTHLSELFDNDDSDLEAIYQSVIIWERCIGTIDQRYWSCLRHLVNKLVSIGQHEEAGNVILRGLKKIESSQLPLLESGCILPQNFEVFYGDTLHEVVYPQLANGTLSFEVILSYVFKVLDELKSRGAALYTSFGCPNFVPKFLLGIIVKIFELWLTLELTAHEYESRERCGQKFVSDYLYLSDGSNLMFAALESTCQNLTRVFEALLTWGASKAINDSYNGQRLFQKVLNVETAPQGKSSAMSPLLELLVSHGVHSDAVDRSGKSAIDCCPELFGLPCPLPLACLAAKQIVKDCVPYQEMESIAPRLKNFVMMHDVRSSCWGRGYQ